MDKTLISMHHNKLKKRYKEQSLKLEQSESFNNIMHYMLDEIDRNKDDEQSIESVLERWRTLCKN